MHAPDVEGAALFAGLFSLEKRSYAVKETETDPGTSWPFYSHTPEGSAQKVSNMETG